MSGERYTVKAVATMHLEGKAKIIDENGKVLREHELSEVGAFQVPLDVDLPCPPTAPGVTAKCGVAFTLTDIFEPWNT